MTERRFYKVSKWPSLTRARRIVFYRAHSNAHTSFFNTIHNCTMIVNEFHDAAASLVILYLLSGCFEKVYKCSSKCNLLATAYLADSEKYPNFMADVFSVVHLFGFLDKRYLYVKQNIDPDSSIFVWAIQQYKSVKSNTMDFISIVNT